MDGTHRINGVLLSQIIYEILDVFFFKNFKFQNNADILVDSRREQNIQTFLQTKYILYSIDISIK